MIILVVNALYFRLRSLLVLVVIECYLLIIMNMPKQVKISATEVAANEPNKAQVFNVRIAGARRYDATTRDGESLAGVVVLFRDAIPVIIDGEMRTANKKWFATNTLIDALIMSEDDNIASKVSDVINEDYMSLRGISATISVFDGEDGELHYKLEF